MVLVILVWIFATLTTLYRDHEAHMCMTSCMKSGPCVSIGHMFKEKAFWIFLCVISWPMLSCIICRCTSRVPRDLVRLYGPWLLSLALWMPSRDARGREMAVHKVVKGLISTLWKFSTWTTLCKTVKEIYTCYADERQVWIILLQNNFWKRKMREELRQEAFGVE